MRHVARRGGGIPPTKHCGAYRREDGGSGGAGSGSEAEPPSTAPNSRGCHARSRSGPQRGGTRENETSRAGLRPEDIYVYVERSQGRANRPFLAGEHRCPDRDHTLEGKPALHVKTIEPRKRQAIPADGICGGCRRTALRRRVCRSGWCQCPRGREVPESRGCQRRAGACERQSSA